jgi:hypothetical protein
MKVRDQLHALAQFDPDEDVLPCFPAGMSVFDCADLPVASDDGSARHFSGAWPNEPRDGDVVRETGKRFGTNRTWTRVRGQWVLKSNCTSTPDAAELPVRD